MGCPNVRQIGNPGRLPSFADCQAACDARDDCDAIQINTRTRHPQNNCLLYSNECNENRVDGVCTSIKDCFYFERVCEDVQVWTIFDRDCAGNDIRGLNVNSLEECKAACISEPLCKGIGRSEKSNSCWLKTVSTCDSVKSRTPVNVCGSGRHCFYSLQAAPVTTTTTTATTTTATTTPQNAYLKNCRWQSTRDRLAADGQHLVGWTCGDNEIITGFGIHENENDVSKIQCCDLGGHSSVIPETCSFIRVGDQEFQPERASCNANDHLMVFSGAYDASKFDNDDYTEILVGKCCEVKCDAPWCQGKNWGINTDQCVTISADADNKGAQDLTCPDGTVVTEVVDGHSGAALGIQKVASVVCCALDVISQPSSAPSLSPTTTEPTYAPSLSPSTTEPTYAPSRSPSKAPSRSPSKTPTRSPSKTPTRSPSKTPTQAPTSTAHCLLALFQCNPPLSDAEILQGIDDCLPNCMVPSDYVVRRALEGRLLSKNAQ